MTRFATKWSIIISFNDVSKWTLWVHTMEPQKANKEPLWLQATSTSNGPKIDQSYKKEKLTKWWLMKKTTKIAMNKSNDDKLVYFISLRMPEGASLMKSINKDGEPVYYGSRMTLESLRSRKDLQCEARL